VNEVMGIVHPFIYICVNVIGIVFSTTDDDYDYHHHHVDGVRLRLEHVATNKLVHPPGDL
jgi:hypothetical protein